MHTLIFANGVISNYPKELPPFDLLIAADGGARHCKVLGLHPNVIIGDLDSLATGAFIHLKRQGVKIIQHPADKDETDLELALQFAVTSGAKQITLYGLLGGRWDMSLANLLLLASPRFSGLDIRAMDGRMEMFIVRSGETLTLHGQTGDTVSVLPLSAETTGITYQGLAYPLENGMLPFGSPRGVSNQMLTDQASIFLGSGILLCTLDHSL